MDQPVPPLPARGYFAIGAERISKALNLGNLMRSAHGFGASFTFTIGATYAALEARSDTSKGIVHLPHYNWASVAELALPEGRDPVATLVTLHPLPTAGGFMDSHIFRKAAGRLPALADLAVLRFNTRGTTSQRGTSEGAFDGGRAEAFIVALYTGVRRTCHAARRP